jgi:hypothetical protein
MLREPRLLAMRCRRCGALTATKVICAGLTFRFIENSWRKYTHSLQVNNSAQEESKMTFPSTVLFGTDTGDPGGGGGGRKRPPTKKAAKKKAGKKR